MLRHGRGLPAVNHGIGAHHFIGGIVALTIGAAVVAGIIVLVVLLVKHYRHHNAQPAVAAAGAETGATAVAGKSALDILSERYARGEIDKPEFIEKKQDLST